MKSNINLILIILVFLLGTVTSCTDTELLAPDDLKNPLEITIEDFNATKDDKSAKYEGYWVQIKNVQFQNENDKFNGTKGKREGSKTIVDKSGNEAIVFTDPSRDFSDKKVPSGSGTIVGYVSSYNGKAQLLLRNLEEGVGQMTNTRF